MIQTERLVRRLLEVIEAEQKEINAKAQGECPEGCVRFKLVGSCVHVEPLEAKTTTTYTAAFREAREAKRLARINWHKAKEKPSEWMWLGREDWKQLPFTYGVYVWVDNQDQVMYVAKATDMRRRHFTWESTQDARWMQVAKIWFLHTGWYEEILEVFGYLKPPAVDKEILDKILQIAKPLVLPEPPPAQG